MSAPLPAALPPSAIAPVAAPAPAPRSAPTRPGLAIRITRSPLVPQSAAAVETGRTGGAVRGPWLALAGLALAVASRLPASADGIMLVQAGAFWMGRDDGAPEEAPLHRVYVPDVWIERHKVTNAEFAAFLNARGRVTPAGERRYDWDDADARIHATGGAWLADAGFERHPAVEVSWFGARDYCAWRGR